MNANDDAASGARLPAGAASRGPLRSAVGTRVRTASVMVAGGFVALLASLVVLGLLAGGLLAGTAWLCVVAGAFRAGPLSRLGRHDPVPGADNTVFRGSTRVEES